MSRRTIKEILLSGADDNCEVCGKSLLDMRDGDDYQLYLHTCSDECLRIWGGKTWPKDEDCPGCPAHKDGPHKFSCSYFGARQIKIPVVLKKAP